ATVWLERAPCVGGRQPLVKALELLEDAAQVVQCLDERRLDRNRPLIARERIDTLPPRSLPVPMFRMALSRFLVHREGRPQQAVRFLEALPSRRDGSRQVERVKMIRTNR